MTARCLAGLTLSIGVMSGAPFVHSVVAPSRVPAHRPATLSESTSEQCPVLADLRSRRDGYAALTDWIDQELLRGTIGMREATERLFYYCVANYPEHLEFIALAETGRNIKTRLARNLMRTFRAGKEECSGGSAMDEIVGRLETELAELPYEHEVAGRLE